MKKYALLVILLAGICLLFCFSEKDYRIYNTKSQKYVSLTKLVNEVQKADVLFFGELHDDALIHELEYQLLKEMFKKNKKTAVSMEMFERDTQPVIDGYFSGKITESDFILRSRAWPNYMTDYKPIVEYTKSMKIPLISANVPRYLASLVSKKGLSILDSLSTEEKKWVAGKVHNPNGLYKEKFFAVMNLNMSMGPNHTMMNDTVMENLFNAQCVKDDTMAESIMNFLKNNPGYRVIHYNGDFHSQWHLGTVERLDSGIKSVVISPLVKNPGEELSIAPEDDLSIADYILIQYRHQNN